MGYEKELCWKRRPYSPVYRLRLISEWKSPIVTDTGKFLIFYICTSSTYKMHKYLRTPRPLPLPSGRVRLVEVWLVLANSSFGDQTYICVEAVKCIGQKYWFDSWFVLILSKQGLSALCVDSIGYKVTY